MNIETCPVCDKKFYIQTLREHCWKLHIKIMYEQILYIKLTKNFIDDTDKIIDRIRLTKVLNKPMRKVSRKW